jgi:uncharacterized protein YceH (UPF0502 family)
VWSPIEARVIGSLVEKDLATPEYYPLSLNGLVLACNQKTNREPVSAHTEDEVREVLTALRHRGLAAEIQSSRVSKFEHRLGERLNLGRGELALLCVLLLRGPQTLNELKDRTARMHTLDDAEAVASALRRMPAGMVVELPRRPGWKEVRWAQLLTGEPEIPAEETAPVSVSGREDRLTRVEQELAELRSRLEELERKFRDLEG